MSPLFMALLLFQSDGKPDEPGPKSGLEAGVIFLHLDDALGPKDRFVAGVEAAFQMSMTQPGYAIGFRAYYRQWEVTFDEFNQLPTDLDGDVQQLGLDLVVRYPLAGPLSLAVELGGGGIRIEHDEDEELAFFFEGGAYLRFDLIAGLYVEAGGGAFGAFTEFGGQEEDSDHVSFIGRATIGLEFDF